MAHTDGERRYRPTESKYKGGAAEMAITYDLEQETRGGGSAVYPKVKRVYIAGQVKDWKVGDFTNRFGRKAHGVMIDYEQTRKAHRRTGYAARHGARTVDVKASSVREARQTFHKLVEVPHDAQNVTLRQDVEHLPALYQDALQAVR